MNSVKVNKRLTPQRAIIVYSTGGYNAEYYLESREFKPVKDKLTMMAPVPLEDQVMKSIASQYIKSTGSTVGHSKIIGPHILHGSFKPGEVFTVWYRSSMERELNFSAKLKIKKVKVITPAILFAALNTKLFVFALETNERPDLNTKLFNAPFFNIYADGNVCLGSANIGRRGTTFDDETLRFEAGFFAAEQNHGIDNLHKIPLNKIWLQLIGKKQAYPIKYMVQNKTYKTLGDLITKIK